MPYLIKTKTGNFVPADDEAINFCKSISAGGEVKVSKARNSKHHRKAFALLNLGFDNQNKFDNFEVYRKILTIKAGFFDIAPTKNGEPYYIPKSLSYEQMSAEDFEKWFSATLNIIATETQTSPEKIQAEIEGFY